MTKSKKEKSIEEIRATRDFYNSNVILINCLRSMTDKHKENIGSQAILNFNLHCIVDTVLRSKTLQP